MYAGEEGEYLCADNQESKVRPRTLCGHGVCKCECQVGLPATRVEIDDAIVCSQSVALPASRHPVTQEVDHLADTHVMRISILSMNSQADSKFLAVHAINFLLHACNPWPAAHL